MKSLFTFLLFVLSYSASAQSYTLRGKVINQQGDPVPFASVYEKNTASGISANSLGDYILRLPPGKYEIGYKSLGFSEEIKQINLQGNMNLDVILQETAYALRDIIIKGDGEDPANEVMRNAIRERKNHLTKPEEYTTEVYIKGMQRLLGAPKKFLGRDIDKVGKELGLDSNRTGIIYLSESESRLSFMQPDYLREEMISSKVSGSNRAFSFNRASDMMVNFYDNFIDMGSLSNRPLISPLADNAFFYYTYRLIGTGMENNQLVNKIQVIPRRNADPVFRGTIYIMEDSWRIHSSDLFISKDANINLVDTLHIRQEYIPLKPDLWMLSSTRLDFSGRLLGFHFGGYFLTLFKNYELRPGLKKNDFNEVLRITPEVNRKDSTYWEQTRPVPLTEEEILDYNQKQILAQRRESQPYLDSLDKAYNQFRPIHFLIGKGYNYRNRYNNESFHFNSLLRSVFYNTVEGFGIDYGMAYSKKPDSLAYRSLNIAANVRYGLSGKKFYGNLIASIPSGSADLGFRVGSQVDDLNSMGTIGQLGNTVNSLFYEKNLLKLYEKKFVGVSLTQRLAGVLGKLSAEWANRRTLGNTSDYTIRDFKNRVFTSNNPLEIGANTLLFPENQSFIISLRSTYDFRNRYATLPQGRVYQPSKYPVLGFEYVKGIRGLFGSDVSFDRLSADLSREHIKLGMYGFTSFWLGAGKFVNATQLYFTDYKHFVGNRTLSYISKANSFLFLDFYKFSTPDQYAEAHVEHNFSGFFVNKVPLLRKTKLTEIAGFNYLDTPRLKNYSEVYFGVQYLNFRGVYGISYNDGRRIDRGFRIAYGF